MPPHLHPRSRMTTSLFTTTLLFSFLVVATPHLLPCPVDPRTLTDSATPDALSGQPRRRRRRKVGDDDETHNEDMAEERRKTSESEEWKKPKRECPVPKPGGLIGKVLGIRGDDDDDDDDEGTISVKQHIERARWKGRSREGE